MITVNTDIKIPNKWEELTPLQAVNTVDLLQDFFSGKLTLEKFRLKLLCMLAGYRPNRKKLAKVPEEQLSNINENLFILSEMLKFPVKPRILTPDIVEVLTDDLQEALTKIFPFEVTRPDWIAQLDMVKNMLKVEPVINLDIRRNLVPVITVNGVDFYGPVFDIDANGVVKTDMIAGEYVDAYEFFNLYNATREARYLDTFVAAMYRNNRKEYSTFDIQSSGELFSDVPVNIKKTVYLWFQSLLEYLSTRSPYVWLFQRRQSTKQSFVLGMGSTIYAMAGKGYGNKKEVELFPLPDYFSIMLSELIDSIRAMKDMDMKIPDIEKKTGLSAEIIIKI